VNTTVVACCQVAPALADPAANREFATHAISHAAASRPLSRPCSSPIRRTANDGTQAHFSPEYAPQGYRGP
jgi:hypothetical protein